MIFDDAEAQLADDSMTILSGSLPGTLSTTSAGQPIGTLTRTPDNTLSGTGAMGPPLGTQQWDSGTATNYLGNTFTLYLLPAQPPGCFEGTDFEECTYNSGCDSADHAAGRPGGDWHAETGRFIFSPSSHARYTALCAAAGLRPVQYQVNDDDGVLCANMDAPH